MTKIVSKKKYKQFYIGDRELLRDKRLSADAKNIYIVLSSLAETCENVCPSYLWLAEEIGYSVKNSDGTEKAVSTINEWVGKRIAELEKLGVIKKIRKDRGFDYEVYDYDPVKKATQEISGVSHRLEPVSPHRLEPVLEIREEKKDYSRSLEEVFPEQKISEMAKELLKARLNLDNELAERVFGLIEMEFWSHYNGENEKLKNPDKKFTAWCFNRWQKIEEIKREVTKTKRYEENVAKYDEAKGVKTSIKKPYYDWNEEEKEFQKNLQEIKQQEEELPKTSGLAELIDFGGMTNIDLKQKLEQEEKKENEKKIKDQIRQALLENRITPSMYPGINIIEFKLGYSLKNIETKIEHFYRLEQRLETPNFM